MKKVFNTPTNFGGMLISIIIMMMIFMTTSCSNQEKSIIEKQAQDSIEVSESDNKNPSMENFISFEEIKGNEMIADNYENLFVEYSQQNIYQEASEHAAAHNLDITNSVSDYNVINDEIGKRVIKESILDLLIDTGWILGSNSALSKTDNVLFRYYSRDNIENIRYKVLREKVSNLVYEKKYQNEILDGISMMSTKTEIINRLGTPNYEDAENFLFGYKNKEFTIFFVGESELEEISIYQNSEITSEELQRVFDQYFSEEGNDFFELINKYLPEYDFIAGSSGSEFFGYETAGLIINYSQPNNKITVNMYGNASNIELDSYEHNTNVQVNRYTDQDAIFDLERYRVLSDKLISGIDLNEKYYLGMAFDPYMKKYFPSPDGSKGFYVKLQTIDDNYPCIYVTEKENYSSNMELIIDMNYTDIYWIDNRYIASMGPNASYLYDTIEYEIISIPYIIGETTYKITGISDEGINIQPN